MNKKIVGIVTISFALCITIVLSIVNNTTASTQESSQNDKIVKKEEIDPEEFRTGIRTLLNSTMEQLEDKGLVITGDIETTIDSIIIPIPKENTDPNVDDVVEEVRQIVQHNLKKIQDKGIIKSDQFEIIIKDKNGNIIN